jgi:hypothetical protein
MQTFRAKNQLAREAGRQHKAWGEAKRNPRKSESNKEEPAKWATADHHGYLPFLRYRTLRALGFLIYRYPGVPLRFTPGFMLAPRFAGLKPN